MDIERIIERLAVYLRGGLDQKEREEIECWVEESEENRRIFEEYWRQCLKIKFADQWEKISLAKAWKQAEDRQEKKKRWLRWTRVAVAAMMIWGVGAVLLGLVKTEVVEEAVVAVQDIPAGEMKAMLTLADGSQVALHAGKTVNIDLGFAQVVEDSLQGLQYRFQDTAVTSVQYNTLAVPRGGEYIMTLSDGTRVWLNSETELKFPVAFTGKLREVYLTGEAYFKVTGDNLRPFVVNTPRTRTFVWGTSFNVMAYESEKCTEVTLVEGKVSVETGKQTVQIKPGYQIAVNNQSLTWTQQKVNPDNYASWKDGIFIFDGLTLGELVVKLERWYDVDFVFEDSGITNKRFTGGVKKSNTLNVILDFIQKTSDIRFEVNNNTILVFNK